MHWQRKPQHCTLWSPGGPSFHRSYSGSFASLFLFQTDAHVNVLFDDTGELGDLYNYDYLTTATSNTTWTISRLDGTLLQRAADDTSCSDSDDWRIAFRVGSQRFVLFAFADLSFVQSFRLVSFDFTAFNPTNLPIATTEFNAVVDVRLFPQTGLSLLLKSS